MPDFEEMYYKMVRASEKAIRIIIEAQRECEEMYISADEETESEKKERSVERSFKICVIAYASFAFAPRFFAYITIPTR